MRRSTGHAGMVAAALRTAYVQLVFILACLAGLIFVAITLSIPVNVALRACCAQSIFGLGDLITNGLAAATFLAAPWVLLTDAHVSVDIVPTHLPSRARKRLGIIVNLLGALVCAILFWFFAAALLETLALNLMVRGIIVFPEWVTLVSPTLSSGLLMIGFLLRVGQAPRASSAPGL